jgi:hypothetical protein
MALRRRAVTMMMAAGAMFAAMPVVRSGLAGSGTCIMSAGLWRRIGWRFLLRSGKNRRCENQREYANYVFHQITPRN